MCWNMVQEALQHFSGKSVPVLGCFFPISGGSPKLCDFLDTQVSLAPTHVSPLFRWLVRDTFEFPLPLNISVQQSSLMTPQNECI